VNADRLLARREVTGDGCWIYTGARTSNGYGSIRHDGRTQYAHRVAYEAFVGPIPAGHDLDHLCRVRACFRPAHLDPVPRLTNLHRSPLTWQANASKTHCPKNHEYTPENTYVVRTKRKAGGHYESRACVTCRRARYASRSAA
jgi:hypothetical protein